MIGSFVLGMLRCVVAQMYRAFYLEKIVCGAVEDVDKCVRNVYVK